MLRYIVTYQLLFILLVITNSVFAQINRNYTYRAPEEQQKTTTSKKKSSKKTETTTFIFKGLEYGFNLGAYLANNRTANYFNGQSGTNSIENIIGKDSYAGSINGTYSPIHQEIKDALGYEFHIKELPLNMHYNPGPLLGFFGKLNVTDYTGIYMEFNYTKLTTNDKFTIETENYATGTITEKALIFGRIQGIEKRYDINVGAFQTFSTTKRFSPYLEAGLNFNTLHVDDASIYIDNKTQTLTYSFINPYNAYYKVRDYGNGYGLYLGGGMRLIFKQSLFLNIGYNMSYKLIKLGVYKGYYLTNTIYLRFNYWQKLWKAEDIER